jgi:hypothetical protein
MSPIEIDPATGAPIVTNNASIPPVAGFEVKPTIPVDAIKPVTEVKPLVGMDNRIEEAKKFNSKLNAPSVPLSVKQEQKVNKDVELRGILKRYGMDSQQQEKAFAEIIVLFN